MTIVPWRARFALAQNTQIVVVSEPYLNAQHVDQQTALRKMIETEFRGEQRVTYVDLGLVLSAADEGFVTDGLHLSAEGNLRRAKTRSAYSE